MLFLYFNELGDISKDVTNEVVQLLFNTIYSFAVLLWGYFGKALKVE